jgi:hypothetical protein
MTEAINYTHCRQLRALPARAEWQV